MKNQDTLNIKLSQRQEVRRALRGMDHGARLRASEVIVDRLGELLSPCSLGVVLLYAALPLEANVWAVARRCPEFRYVLPRVIDGKPLLELREFSSRETDLAPGAFGIEEPLPERCPLVAPAAVDHVLVPGMAFTPAGDRLGKGGGYYDRLLGHPEFRARRLGVCFDCQIVDEIAVEDHDEGVDLVVTDKRVFS